MKTIIAAVLFCVTILAFPLMPAAAGPHASGSKAVDGNLESVSFSDRTKDKPPRSHEIRYRSPIDVCYSPDGSRLAVSDYTAGEVVLIDAANGSLLKRVALKGQPCGAAWSADGKNVYVAERGAGSVAEVNAADGSVGRRFAVGRYPTGVAAAASRLVVANSGISQLSVVDLVSGRETGRVPCVYRPRDVALTPDGATAVVGNLQPAGEATDAAMAAAVSLIDVAAPGKIKDIRLPPGSINVRGIAVSPDGRWAYVVHSLGRFTLPTTQLERGWVMTHAMSVIDLTAGEHSATVLLDYVDQGAADPWDVVVSAEGAAAWISLAGIHQVARLDLAALHALIDEKGEERSELVNDLSALYRAGVIRRQDVAARGPRGMALAPDQSALAVADYFGGSLVLLSPASLDETARITFGEQPAATPERQGEQHYFDAELCFQNWLSCASCHPEARADGLNWDLLNDGIGNPKNTRPHPLSAQTPPVMSTGVRPSMEVATEKGFMYIQFRIVEEVIMDSVRAYIRSLRPEPSPYLLMKPNSTLTCKVCHHNDMDGTERPAGHMRIDGTLTAEAERGLELFVDEEVGCAGCHPGPLFTDLKMHDVGTRHELDRRDDFDSPTCHELWRTAPFLHDGSAATLMDMLTTHNEGDRHGKTSHLSEDELNALEAYLKSL